MAIHMTTTELHRLRNVFEKLDVDGTGSVSIEQLMVSLKGDVADGKTAETLASLDLQSFDLDGDGQIDWQEVRGARWSSAGPPPSLYSARRPLTAAL